MTLIDASLPLILGVAFSLILGLVLIPWLRRLKIGQQVRSDGPKRHQAKAGTPTIGGVIFIAAAPLSVAVSHALLKTRPTAVDALVLFFPAFYGAVGFIDDYRKVRRGRSLGLKAREKMALQILFAAIFMYLVTMTGRTSSVIVPFTGTEINLGAFYGLFGVLVIVSAGNAVNLTDGLDGLATGTVAIALTAYCHIATASESILGTGGLRSSILAWLGALLGFLVFNRHPARVFMGDTGSNALGALLAAIAILTRTELVLVFIAGIPVIETISDILQVASFQLFGKRVFKMAPLHHHFELCGWKETRIVLVFWLVEAILALIGIASMAAVR